jgi:4'-phosphopantetheinyl transferase EntD
MIGAIALGCFIVGFIAAWLLRTGYVMTQISWAQQQMERKVRYWQAEALHARAVAEHALRQLAASTGRAPEPPDWPDQDTDWNRPDLN